jgi:hypothetical protein
MLQLDALLVVLSFIKVENVVLIIGDLEVPVRNLRVFCVFFVGFYI